MYWRYLVSISLSLLLVAFLNEQFKLAKILNNPSLLPTFFWGIIAVFFFSVSFFQNKGLPYVFFGSKLQLRDTVWSKFNLMVVSLFLALAVIGYIVSLLVNKEIWSLYKLYGQTSGLVFYPLFATWFLTKYTKT